MGDVEPRLGSVLVTGAQGYLGGAVLRRLQSAGRAAVGLCRNGKTGVACDLLDGDAVRDMVSQVRPEVVIHCAAAVPKAAADYNDLGASELSARMVENLLTASVERVVFSSSMTVYPSLPTMPVHENDVAPTSAYGQGKLRSERLLLQHPQAKAVVLRLPGLFGPPRRNGLVYGLFRALVGKAPLSLPQEPILWAAMHIEDAADILVRAALQFPERSVVANAGYPDVLSIPIILRRLSLLCDADVPYTVDHPDFQMDLTTLTNLVGPPPACLDKRLAEILDYARGEA